MVNAPKLIGDTWFNSKPLDQKDLKGKVVLYDFWTYSCVNCQRTLPYLKSWWERYKDKNFVLVGIHTPEFEFEKDPKNVEQAIKDMAVTWPVVLDNEYKNWNNFANRFWPAKYLTDKDGKIIYTHFGEGAYSQTEGKIRELLGLKTINHAEMTQEHSHGEVCFIPTPETYCGWGRGNPLKDIEPQRDGEVSLKGSWKIEKEYVESQGADSKLVLNFHATEVNLVAQPVENKATITVSFEGQQEAGENILGKDVNKDGEVAVTGPALYNLLKSRGLIEGKLTISVKGGLVRAYAFTFSGC